MNDYLHLLITWTTYGTWLPGDSRGWRSRKGGVQLPQPLLERWCQSQMVGKVVLLKPHDRNAVEEACHEHCVARCWSIHAVNARTNHVHVVVTANQAPQRVRDQLKANCTRKLRVQEIPLNVEKTWIRGGDCEVLDSEADIEDAVLYVTEAQDRNP